MLTMNKEKAIETLEKIDAAVSEVSGVDLESLNPKETVLIVVDMVNGFVKEGLLSSPRVDNILLPILRLIERCNVRSIPIIAFADSHPENSPEFKKYGVHCVEGTKEAEIVDDIKAIAGEFYTIKKNSTNGFIERDFMHRLNCNPQFKNFIVVGDCTDICIEQFAITLRAYFDMKNDQEARVIVPRNLVATFDYDIHNGDFFNTLGLFNMMRNGVEVVREIK